MATGSLDLLEYLARAAGCEYLSDLRCRASGAMLEDALRAVAAERFPAEQWREALYYLTGRASPLPDAPGCRQALLEHCSGRKKKNVSRP